MEFVHHLGGNGPWIPKMDGIVNDDMLEYGLAPWHIAR